MSSVKTLKIQLLSNKHVDRDEVLLHTAFQVLKDYMEKENPQILQWDRYSGSNKIWREMKYLYRWWTKIRPARKDPFDPDIIECPSLEFEPIPEKEGWGRILPYDKEKYKDYDKARRAQYRAEARWRKQDQRNLHRLIDIRIHLWT